jgi:integrase/recombinase XerD
MIEVAYAGGLRVSELLPEIVSRSLSSLRGDAGANDPVFKSRQGDGWLTERAVHSMMKRAAKAAGISEAVSPHLLRHAHGSHAIERGASLPEVQATLGHGNISTTSGYLHARPDSSSGLWLDPGVFLQ